MKRVICIDFDGVIHEYRGWNGEGKFNDPVQGAKEGIDQIREAGYKVLIFTCRIDTDAVKEWMDKHDIEYDGINEHLVKFSHTDKTPTMKPLADAYVDDKAVHFSAWDNQTVAEILNVAKPRWENPMPTVGVQTPVDKKTKKFVDPRVSNIPESWQYAQED